MYLKNIQMFNKCHTVFDGIAAFLGIACLILLIDATLLFSLASLLSTDLACWHSPFRFTCSATICSLLCSASASLYFVHSSHWSFFGLKNDKLYSIPDRLHQTLTSTFLICILLDTSRTFFEWLDLQLLQDIHVSYLFWCNVTVSLEMMILCVVWQLPSHSPQSCWQRYVFHAYRCPWRKHYGIKVFLNRSVFTVNDWNVFG